MGNKIHILHLKRVFDQFGGADNVFLSLMADMSDSLFSSHIILLKDRYTKSCELEIRLKEDGCDYKLIEWMDKKSFITITKQILSYCRENKIGLINSYDPRSDLVALLVSWQSNIPSVASVNGWVWTKWWIKLFEATDLLSLYLFDGIITMSDYQKSLLCGNMKIDNKKIQPIYPVAINKKLDINTLYKKGEAKRDIGFTDEVVVIGCVGRLSKEKGQEYLLRGFAQISSRYPLLKLLIAGDGDERLVFINLAKKLGIEKSVLFTGFISNINTIYPAIDIYVCPSIREVWGLSIQEAVRFNIPVIATSVGGIPELIKDGETGYIVPPKNGSAIAEKICDIMKDRTKAKEMADNAVIYHNNHFNKAAMIKRVKDFYLRVLRPS